MMQVVFVSSRTNLKTTGNLFRYNLCWKLICLPPLAETVITIVISQHTVWLRQERDTPTAIRVSFFVLFKILSLSAELI